MNGSPLTADDLYLVYQEGGSFKLAGSDRTVTYVAADERDPYHGMYAVWEKLPTVRVVKTDADSTGTYLAGAAFTLTNQTQSGVNVAEIVSVAEETGVLIPVGLADGHYALTETSAPDGYVVMSDDVMLYVYNGRVYASYDPEKTPAEGAYSNELPTDADGNYILTVGNHAGEALPRTGGEGVRNLMYLGGTICALAVVLLAAGLPEKTRRKLKIIKNHPLFSRLLTVLLTAD